MKHYMDLWDDSFKAIKSRSKTIEMRLNDEKRSLINEGDIVEFTNTKTREILICKVKALYKYANFEELYIHHDKTKIGYLENEEAKPSDMLIFYSKDKIKKYGVVGIEVEVIN